MSVLLTSQFPRAEGPPCYIFAMPQLPRRVNQSLLKNINGRPIFKTFRPPREPEDVLALPESSSNDEDEEKHLEHKYVDSSDDDDPSATGDLTRTEFGSKSLLKTPANRRQDSIRTTVSPSPKAAERTHQRRSIRQASGPNLRKRTVEGVSDDEGNENSTATSKKAKTGDVKSFPSIGDHINFERRVTGQQKPAKAAYGKKAQRSQNSTLQPKFDVRKLSETPEKVNVFKASSLQAHISSPTRNPRLSQTIGSEEGVSSPLTDLESSVSSDPPRPLQNRKERQRPKRGQSIKSKKQRREITPEAVSQRPEFRMPEGYNDYAPSSQLADFEISIKEVPMEKKGNLDPGKALCPMCEEQVDKGWLQDFSRGQRMTVARQAKFCRMHKRKTAQKTWEERGYPEIDWKNLVARIEGHYDYIESLIRGKISHFGELHQEKINTGKNRTLLKTEDYLTPGYYGLRGMSLMTETIIEIFSSLLRERAPRDRLISARGYTGFVQSVLVPELATKLIQGDMSLGADEARKVMQDSRAVGEILNDEKREPQRQTRAKEGSGAEDHAGQDSETSDNKSDDMVSVELKIHEVADSDSDLSSVTSMGGGKKPENKVPVETRAQEVDNSDSDLSSVGDW